MLARSAEPARDHRSASWISSAATASTPRDRGGAGAAAGGAGGVDATRSREPAAGEGRPDGAQPRWGSARVPRGPATPPASPEPASVLRAATGERKQFSGRLSSSKPRKE